METATEETQKESTDSAVSSNTINNATAPPQYVEPKKSKKEDRSKKDDKSTEIFMKSLNSIPSLEGKLDMVCKKYMQTAEDNKKMQFYIKQSDKRYALLLKEKEQLQLDFNKTILVKSKLENLCRELQKQNKAIKEESLLKIREEEERRKDTQAKFQNTLSEITAMLQQNNEKNAKLREDNISMTEKFKSVVTQYQLREQQVDKLSKQMSLENQLSEAKMQKASLEHQADKERLLSEMEQLKVTVATYRAKIMELQGTETNLRSQLAVYTEKYDEFQNALVKSNQMFGGFKEQMDKMSKKIKKLEKESLSWKTRWETSQTALLDMCGERQASEERAAAAARQLQHMQGLCRTLQAERTVLLGTLKEHNIERPPLPAPAPAPPTPPAPAPASDAKVDAMAANCAQLRQSLAHLQSQLNVLTNKQKEDSPQPEPQPEKQEKKKSKSKKSKAEKKALSNAAKEESDDKDLTDDNQLSANESTNQNAEKVDSDTLENLIQAINNADINLCDLEVGTDEIAEIVKEIPRVQEIIEGPKVQEIKESPKIQEIIETPKVQEIKEIPKVQEIIENPMVQEANESPKVQKVKEAPKVQEIKESPEVQEIEDTPKVQEVKDTPKVQEIKETPKVQEIKETPKVQEFKETPKVQEIKETPKVQEIKETPKVKEINENPKVQETNKSPKVQKGNKSPKAQKGNKSPKTKHVNESPKVQELNESKRNEEILPSNGSSSNVVVDSSIIENGAMDALACDVKKIKQDVPKVEENVADSSQNVSIMESSNEEISHINEVKPISDSA